MGLFEHWPYVNFHDLNLDWIIKEIPKVFASRDEAQASAEESAESAEASQRSAEASQQSAEASQQSAEASQRSAEASHQSAEDAEQTVTTTLNQINLLQSRVDNIIPQGTQTEGNTELIDIRVAYGGQVYDSAGNSVRGQISDLTDSVTTGELPEYKNITWKNGYVNLNGAILSSSLSKFGIVQMEAGEVLYLGTEGDNISVISSTDLNDVSVGDTVAPIQTKESSGYATYTYAALENINIVVCVRISNYNLVVKQKTLVKENKEDIDVLKTNVNSINTTLSNMISKFETPVYEHLQESVTMTTGVMLKDGTIRTDYDTYQYSNKISVSTGDIITPISVNDNATFRFLCAFNDNAPVPDKGVSTAVTSYTVPENINGVVISSSISFAVTGVNIEHLTGTVEKIYVKNQELGSVNWKGNINSGDSVRLLGSNVKYNVVWNFTGHITTMGKITIGIMTTGGTLKELCSVDETKLYYRSNDGTTANVPHGLTIADDLQIKIEAPFKVRELGGITICSDGVEYTLPVTCYGTDMDGYPYLLSTGAVMSDCSFSWIPKDIDKPIWIFGDSWVSMFDTRWPYYMVRDGYVNSWMLNGFAGEGTDEAYDSLLNLLTIRKPDYIVWMLGMNNGDSGTAVNTVWKNIYDNLVQLCSEYKINLILYTVPNTPTINNNFKNEIVRSSGYRYIDGCAALGDDGNGNWFTGFEQSASDHNHTSSKGARALFYRILSDFPEIAGNSL